MNNKTVEILKKANIISIIIYMLVYLISFFNIEEMLVIVNYGDGFLIKTRWDEYSWLMIWVGIAFSIELCTYSLLRKIGIKYFAMYLVTSLMQIIMIGIGIYGAINNIMYASYNSHSDIIINIMCYSLIIFLIFQVLMWALKMIITLKDRHMICNVEMSQCVENRIDIESRKRVIKLLRCSLIITMILYYRCVIPLTLVSTPWLIIIALIFSMCVLILPCVLFIRNVVSDIIKQRRYMLAIASIILYVMTLNNVYGHLVDRYFYGGGTTFIWVNFILELANMVICGIAIYLIYRMYREPVVDEQLKTHIASLNDKKSKKTLFLLIIAVMLFTPIGVCKGSDSYVYGTLWYSVEFKNVYNTPVDELYEINELKGIKIKILGGTIYSKYIMPTNEL